MQEGEVHTESGEFPELKRSSYEFGMIHREYQEERIAQWENLRHLWRIPLEYSTKYWSVYLCEEIIWDLKQTLKYMRKKRFWHSQKVLNNAYVYQPVKKNL